MSRILSKSLLSSSLKGMAALPAAALILAAGNLASANAQTTDEIETQSLIYVTASAMVDVLEGELVQNPVLVIEEGTIKSVGTSGSIIIPEAATVYNLDGQTIMPGMIDMHVHITSDPVRTVRNSCLLYTSPSPRDQRGSRMPSSA